MDTTAKNFSLRIGCLCLMLSCLSACVTPPPAVSAPKPLFRPPPAATKVAVPKPNVAGKPMFVLQAGHAKTISALAFSPDGKLFATASEDNSVRLFQTEGMVLRAVLLGHDDAVNALAFSPDGKRLVTGSSDETARIWNTKSGKMIRVLEGHGEMVSGVAFSSDGRQIVTSAYDKTLRLFDWKTGKIQKTTKHEVRRVRAVAFQPDGPLVASVTRKTLVLWNTKSGKVDKLLIPFEGDKDESVSKGKAKRKWGLRRRPRLDGTTVTFSPDGKMVATGHGGGMVRLWNVANRKMERELKGHTYRVTSVTFSPDGGMLASASWDKKVRLWDPGTGKLIRKLEGHTQWIGSVAFSPDGTFLATASNDATVRLWGGLDGVPKRSFRGVARSDFYGVALHPGGDKLAAASGDNTVRFWHQGEGGDIEEEILRGHSGTVFAVAFDPAGRRLVSAGRKGEVVVWSVRTRRRLRRLQGHSDLVYAAVFSPDGKMIATAGRDGTVRLWKATTGESLQTIRVGAGSIGSIAFSPDGTEIATGGGDGWVRCLSVETGETVATLPMGRRAITSVRYSSDGRWVATASLDRNVRVWDRLRKREKWVLKAHTRPTYGAEFSPDGQWLVTGGADKMVRVWSVATGKLETTRATGGRIWSMAMSPDGLGFVTGGSDAAVHLWQGRRAKLFKTLQVSDEIRFRRAVFSPNGKQLATVSKDKLVRLWDAASGKVTMTLKGPTEEPTAVVWSPDGRRVAASAHDGYVWVWNVQRRGRLVARLEGHRGSISAVAFSPDGKWIASTGTTDKLVRLWDAATGRSRVALSGHERAPQVVAFSRDGKHLVSSGYGEKLLLWDTKIALEGPRVGRPALIKTLRGHTRAVTGLAFSPDDTLLASASLDGHIRLWDRKTGESVRTLHGHDGGVFSISFHPKGNVIASAGGDLSARLWDVKTGKPMKVMSGHRWPIEAIAFEPSGKLLASGGQSGILRMWDPQSGAQKGTLQKHADSVASVAVSPDGKTLVLGSDDKTIRFWDTATGALAHTLKGHWGKVEGVAISPDGKWLASAGRDKLRLWDLKTRRERSLKGRLYIPAQNVSFSADGTTMAAVSNSKVLVWKLDRNERFKEYRKGYSFLWGVALNPSGDKFVTAGKDGAVRLWDLGNQDGPKLVHRYRFEGRNVAATAVAYHPSGRLFASAGGDGKAHLWASDTGKLLHTLTGHTDSVMSVAFSADGKWLVTGSEDKTARIWNAKTGEPIKTLGGYARGAGSAVFSPDRSFIAATDVGGLTMQRIDSGVMIRLAHFKPRGSRPASTLVYTDDGLFSGDEAAYERVRFRVGKDLGAADMLSADQMFDSFYRPSLMQDFLSGRPLKLRPQVEEGVGLPPKVDFVGMSKRRVKTDRERVKVRLRATDRGGGVSEIRVFVNGARQGSVGGDDGGKARHLGDGKRFDKDVELLLAPGKNIVTAEAYSKLGRIRSRRARRTIVLEGKKIERPALHLLVMTVEQYADPSMNLNYPNEDGDALVRAFMRQKGRLFGQVHVHRIRDAEASPASVEQLLKLIASKARPSDVFMMYASGHGGMVRCEGESKPGYRLLTYRASLQSDRTMCSEAIAMDRLTRKMRAVKANKKLLLLDSCQSGAASSGDVLLAMRGAAQVDAIKRLARAEGLAILSASTDREFAYEVKSLGHGLFTYALLKGLDGGAALKGEEIVSVFGLLQYVDRHLPGIAKKYIRREQRSVQTFQGQDFPLFALSKSDSPLVTPDKGAASKPDAPAKKVELTVATEKKIRAHIEQKAPVVFVCSDAAALSIRGKVAADGFMRFEAYKPAQPRAAARCIQTALGEVNVGRMYVGLEVIHPMGRPPKPAPATDAPPKPSPEAPN